MYKKAHCSQLVAHNKIIQKIFSLLPFVFSLFLSL